MKKGRPLGIRARYRDRISEGLTEISFRSHHVYPLELYVEITDDEVLICAWPVDAKHQDLVRDLGGGRYVAGLITGPISPGGVWRTVEERVLNRYNGGVY